MLRLRPKCSAAGCLTLPAAPPSDVHAARQSIVRRRPKRFAHSIGVDDRRGRHRRRAARRAGRPARDRGGADHRRAVVVGLRRHPRRRRGLLGRRAHAGPAAPRRASCWGRGRGAARAVPAARRPAAADRLRRALARRLQHHAQRGRAADRRRHGLDARQRRAGADRGAGRRAAEGRLPAPPADRLRDRVRRGRRDRARDVGRQLGRGRRRGALRDGRAGLRRRRGGPEAAAGAHRRAADHVPGLRRRGRRVPAVRAPARARDGATRARPPSPGCSTWARSHRDRLHAPGRSRWRARAPAAWAP